MPSLGLIIFIVTASYSVSADDPLLINHKHRRRSLATEYDDARPLIFRFDNEPSNTIVSPDGSALLHCKYGITSPLSASFESAQNNNVLISAESDEDQSTNGQKKEKIVTRVIWRKDGSPLHPVGRFKLLANGSLLLEGAVPADEGQYQCAVHVSTPTSEHGKPSNWVYLSRRAVLSLPSLHRFEQHPMDQHVRIGQMAAFRCLLDSKPAARIEWYHDSQLVMNAEDGYSVLPVSQTLELVNVQPKHAGVYKCVARNGDRSRTSQISSLTVLEGEDSPQSMNWVLEPRNQLVTVGDPVILECLANNGGSRQTTKIQWLHNSVPINLDIRTDFEMVGKRKTHLLIRNFTAQSTGQFTCRAENSWRTQDVTATVAARVPPKITVRPSDVLTQETNDVEFECVAEGVPTPRITWHKNGEVIIPSEYFVIASNKLRIFGLVTDDQGIYQCIADNEVGSEQAAALLLVDQAASHLPLVSPASDGSFINSADIEVQAPPLQPLSLQATEIRAQSIHLRWDPPLSQKLEPIGHYIVYYRDQGSARERSSNSTVTSTILEGLQPTTVYHIRVVAVNRAGLGKPSETLMVTTSKQEALPGKVRNLHAQVLSSESIQVDWNQPESTDGPSNSEFRYKLFYMKWPENNTKLKPEGDEEDDDGSETQVLMVKTSYTLHGIEKNALYSIRVEAENVHGTGPSSDRILIRTWPDAPSASPQHIRVDLIGSDAVRVRWTPPPRDQWNGPLIGYKIRHKVKGRAGAKANTLVVEGGSSETYSLENLESGSMHLIRVAALNQNGTGPWTDWVEIETPDEEKEEIQVAGAPSELRVRATQDSVHVSWLPPRDDNVLIRGYLIGWGINIPDMEQSNVEPDERQFTIRGLKANREYVISVRAFNKVGHGFPIYETVKTSSYGYSSSSSSSAVENSENTKQTFGFGRNSNLPPVGVTAEAISSSQIRLFWLDPNENAFNQYYTIKYGLSTGEGQHYKLLNTTETEHTFDGLKPDTPYEFAVKLAESQQWSLNAINRTFPAPPSSPPRDLTAIGPHSARDDPGMVTLTWQPPKYANGEIQEYIVLYSDRPNVPERDWVMDSVKGDRLSIVVRTLLPSRIYHFKLQARNVKGYGPFSPVITFTTPPNTAGEEGTDRFIVGPNSNSNEPGFLVEQLLQMLNSNLAFVLFGALGIIVLLLAIALTAACVQRKSDARRPAGHASHRKPSRRASQQPYIPGRRMSSATPPQLVDDDLWIQNQNSAGGGRFAALVSTATVEDFDMTSTSNGGVLLFDGQQRAFIAPGTNHSPHYQAYQRQETEVDEGILPSTPIGSSALPRSMVESFHSVGDHSTMSSPKVRSAKLRRQHRNSLPPHICPSSSCVSPLVAIKHAKKASEGRQEEFSRSSTNFTRKSDSPTPTAKPEIRPTKVATVRIKNGISKSSLNALDPNDPYYGFYRGVHHHSSCSPAKSSSTPKTDEPPSPDSRISTFQVGIGLPSLGLRVKEAKRTVTANYSGSKQRQQATAPIKCVNFASKLVIVGDDGDDSHRKRKKEEMIAFIDDVEPEEADDEPKKLEEEVENGNMKSANEALNSVGTLSRAHHHNHHDSATSLEMKGAHQPMIYHHQQQQLTPLTPRNSHVVYTRVDRQPIAKVDFSTETSGDHPTPSPYGDRNNSHHHQQQTLFVGDGSPPLPPPPLNNGTNLVVQDHRNSSDGYQTVRGFNPTGSMRSFANSCSATATGEQQHVQQGQQQQTQPQRMAHIVRPIVYADGQNSGASPSPSTLRSAIGQPQAQKSTPTIGHKFSNGAKVPVGRATAQPRVNLAAEDSTSSGAIYTSSSSPYSSVRVHAGVVGAKDAMNGGARRAEAEQHTTEQFKSVDSAEDLQKIDQMIETLQQLQQDFTDNTP